MSDQAKTEGNELFKKKDYKGAIEKYTLSITLDPNNYLSYSNRSACLYFLEQYEESLNDAKKCVEINPQFAKGYLRCANNYSKMNDHEKASQSYSKYLEFEYDEDILIKLENSLSKCQHNEIDTKEEEINELIVQLEENYKSSKYNEIKDYYDKNDIEAMEIMDYDKAKILVIIAKALKMLKDERYWTILKRSIQIYPLKEAFQLTQF